MRALIVDDEHYIVNYIASLIEEQNIPDLEIYKCYSGAKAVQLVQSIKMDLIFLDIHMPGMSGIETAEYISDYLPNCRIIFLTAYNNFENIYATEKIKHSRYLLKTETDETILEVFHSTISEIRKETENLHLLSVAQQKTLLLAHLLHQNILKGIFSGQDIHKLCQDFHSIGADFPLDPNEPVYLMYTQIHYRTFRESRLIPPQSMLAYLQLMENLTANKWKFTMLDMEHGVMLWIFQPITSFSAEFIFFETIANDFSNYCSSVLHRQMTVVLYPETIPMEHTNKSFYLLQKYAESFVTSAPLVYSSVNIFDDDSSKIIQRESSSDRPQIEQELQELSFSLYQGVQNDYYNTLQQMEYQCTSLRSMHDIRAIKIYTSIALMLLNYIDLYQLPIKLSSKIAIYPLYYTHDFSSWKDAFQYLRSLSQHLFDIQASEKSDKNNVLIKKIKSYIEEHLGDSITLTIISRVVNYNETYISRLFKQLTGISLSEYISQERIKRAKHLLSSTSESIQDIARATGFDTSQYFSIVFKKATGVSPSTYRRMDLYSQDLL